MKVTRRRVGGTMDFHPKTPEERIAAFRQIVDDKAYAKIDGCMIDLFSANYVVQVYDALNETNKQKFASRVAPLMTHIAFKLVK
ncbi:MAG: hypothetical protein ACWGQW_03210 [bacterium]